MPGYESIVQRISHLQALLRVPERPSVEAGFDAALASAESRPVGIEGHIPGPVTLGDLVFGQASPGTSSWAIPALGPVVSGFGERIDPFTGALRMHKGIDIDAPAGASIVAVAPGTVTFAGERGGFGKLVVVDHGNGTETYYAHQSRIDVTVGDQVATGQLLGAVGSTGRSTGPHLHFEVRVGGLAVDPETHLWHQP